MTDVTYGPGGVLTVDGAEYVQVRPLDHVDFDMGGVRWVFHGHMLENACGTCGRGDVGQAIAGSLDEAVERGWLLSLTRCACGAGPEAESAVWEESGEGAARSVTYHATSCSALTSRGDLLLVSAP